MTILQVLGGVLGLGVGLLVGRALRRLQIRAAVLRRLHEPDPPRRFPFQP